MRDVVKGLESLRRLNMSERVRITLCAARDERVRITAFARPAAVVGV